VDLDRLRVRLLQQGSEFAQEHITEFFADGSWREALSELGVEWSYENEQLSPSQLEERSPATRLHGFFYVSVPEELQKDALSLLRDHAGIRQAWKDPELTHAALGVPAAPVVQLHLGSSPSGVGADFAFGHGLNGAGTAFADVETGWFDHNDITQPLPQTVGSLVQESDGKLHGTNVLGVVLADNNSHGVAPKAKLVALGSAWDGAATSVAGMAAAISAVTAELAAVSDPADPNRLRPVMLLELQIKGSQLPLESVPSLRHWILAAVNAGITVIEPAGNGDNNLDLAEDLAGFKSMSRWGTEAHDSGAVMVGGVDPENTLRVGNYGARVDCHGWGSDVVTPGTAHNTTGVGNDFRYRVSFDGTSAASAMIAGVALSRLSAGDLNPSQLRSALRDLRNGSRRLVEAPLGAQPDLRHLTTRSDVIPSVTFQQAPSVDEVPGLGRSTALFFTSKTQANATSAWGSGSGTEDAILHEGVAASGGRVVLRSGWSGTNTSGRTEVHLAWFPLSTLPDPSQLNSLGKQAVTGIAAGRLKVGSKKWPSTRPATPVGSVGLVARAVGKNEPDVPFKDWHWSNLMVACRDSRHMTCVNSHPARADDSATFVIGGAGGMDVVFRGAGSLTVDGVAVPSGHVARLIGGVSVDLAWTGASGTIEVLHFWSGRQVGAIEWRIT
jgi:hypothetical protein